MAVFRVEKTRDYTVMANNHLRNTALSLKAKGLLSLMLSLSESWDYTTKGLAAICKDGVDSICAAVKELEDNGYVLRRRIRNEKRQLTTTEYTILEKPREATSPKRENSVLGNPVLENPILGKPEQAKPILENPDQLNTYISKTNSINTDLLNMEISNPYPSNPYLSSTKPQRKMRYDEIGCDSVEEVKEMVLENLEYEFIKQSHNRERLDEIVDIMVETLCSSKPTINISGDEYPVQLVKEKLLRINSMHISYVFECLDKTTTYIRNIKRYLLTTLFNAPSTIDNYYTSLVNHDLYGGK
jgi:hypothetical protein